MPTAAKSNVADSYMQLIGQFPLRRIKTAADHAKAKRLVLRLSSQNTDRGTMEYLDVLVDLIAKYEEQEGQRVDSSDLSAAELVSHRIEQRGMSISALAREIGVAQSNLSEMLSGKRAWSKTAIGGIARTLNIRAERFFG
ncbi:MAG: helix-turn-helix domain-containing protein [Tepidisphaeraceae bacterium]